MTIKLTEQLKNDLILIDPYYNMQIQKKIFNVCINTMMKLREQAGIQPKEKGRPKVSKVLSFKESEYPQEVKEAVKRIPILMKQMKIEQEKKKKEKLERKLKRLQKKQQQEEV